VETNGGYLVVRCRDEKRESVQSEQKVVSSLLKGGWLPIFFEVECRERYLTQGA
jgi:hypothetical protein